MLCIRLNQIIDTWVSNIDLTLYSNGGTKHVFQDLTHIFREWNCCADKTWIVFQKPLRMISIEIS